MTNNKPLLGQRTDPREVGKRSFSKATRCAYLPEVCPSRYFWYGSALLYQIEFLGATDGGAAIVHAEFAEDIFGVGAHGVKGNYQLAGNFRAI